MSIFQKVVLDTKTDNTPGDPVAIFAWVDRIQPFVFPSSGYTAAAASSFQLQWAADPAGPWSGFGGDVTIAPGDAGKLLYVDPSNSLITSAAFLPYIRAKLSTSPTGGSVDASVYLRMTPSS